MSETVPEKYSVEEWNHIRKRFFNSILNETEIVKLGQNVGISWPFKGSSETPAKYIELEFDELQSVPGLIGKMSRIKTLMDILRETLAFDDPFGEMVDAVETESLEDHTFELILIKLEIPANYPADFIHFTEKTRELLRREDVNTLIECINFGQKAADKPEIGDDLKTFINCLAHYDEEGVAKRLPYRRGNRGLYFAEAIGLICEDLIKPAKLQLIQKGGASLNDEESQILSAADESTIEDSIKSALEQLAKVADWFTAEASDLKEIYTAEGSPERYFIMINEPERERIAVQLARLYYLPEGGNKSGFIGRLFGK